MSEQFRSLKTISVTCKECGHTGPLEVTELESNTAAVNFVAKLKHRIESLESQLRAADELARYVEHTRDCILSFWEAGEPTVGGGYRTKINGQWYKNGEEPKCDCGLSDVYAVYEKARGIK